MDDFERTQQGGGSLHPLFAFTLASIGPRRRWKNVVERAQFRADLRQLREPVTGDDIGLALTEALHTAIERELRREVRHPNDFVNFNITAHGFTHAYQSINFQVGEFSARSVRLNELLQQLAVKLNSNESFDYQQGFHGPVAGEEKREMSEESVWTMKTRKKDASLPSKTMMISAVGVPS